MNSKNQEEKKYSFMRRNRLRHSAIKFDINSESVNSKNEIKNF